MDCDRGFRPRDAGHSHWKRVFARCLSSLKDERVRASAILQGPTPQAIGVLRGTRFIENYSARLYCSKIHPAMPRAYAAARGGEGARLEFEHGRIAADVSGGCIIPLGVHGDIKKAFDKIQRRTIC